MSKTHFEIPKTAGYKVIASLAGVILAMCCWGLNRYLAAEDKHESKQEARMDTAQQAIQAGTTRLLELNSEVDVHAVNRDAHREKAKATGG